MERRYKGLPGKDTHIHRQPTARSDVALPVMLVNKVHRLFIYLFIYFPPNCNSKHKEDYTIKVSNNLPQLAMKLYRGHRVERRLTRRWTWWQGAE